MNATFKLLPAAVMFADAAEKPAVLQTLAEVFAGAYRLDRDVVEEALGEREALGSTGFGRKVALPHARIDGLQRPVAAVVRLAEPVEYAAADGRPIDIAFGLLSPSDCGVTHLHALAAISRMMRDEETLRLLRSADSPDAIYALLTNVSDRDAA